MTVTCHVDNLKVYHKDLYQITKFAGYLSRVYIDKLIVKQGNLHDYLGMDQDYSEQRSVKVYMIKYIGKTLIALLENIVGDAASPDADHLFKVRDEKEAKYLP